MRVRRAARLTAAVTGGILLSTALLAPVAASPRPGGFARPTDDACPAGAVPEDVFGDVAADSPHEAPIDCLVWWGIARGVTRASYAPLGDVRRDQLATFVVHLLEAGGAALPEPSRDHFTDDGESVHERSINRLAEAGVLGGTGDGRFEPARSVDRAQTATYLVQAYDELARQTDRPPLPVAPDAFSDDNDTTHEGNINRAAEAGIAAGTGGDAYAPLVAVRRDQMASFVTRTLDLLVENGMASPPPARAGDLDPSYGEQGVVRTELGEGYDEGRAAALDGEGRLVVGGESSVRVDTGGHVQQVRVFTLTRLLPDGAPDPAFAGDGTVAGEPGDPFRVLSVAVQPDGKVLAGGFAICGRMCTASVLARFNPDGTADTSFGDAGRVTLTADETGPVFALAVDDEGRIVAGGQTRPVGSADFDDFSVVRYLPTGALDPSFGVDGRVRRDVRGGSDVVSSLALQPDGAIVVGGTSFEPDQNAPTNPAFAVARLLADGSPDPGFGQDGTALADVHVDDVSQEALASLAVAPDGAILAAGHLDADGVSPVMAVVRWRADGSLDEAFGSGGVAEWQGARVSQASSLAVQPDGRLVVAGRAADNPVAPGPGDGPGQLGIDTDWTWALLRLTPDGALDPSFGEDGVVRTAVGKQARAMVVQQDGRIVVAGCSCPGYLSGDGGVETESALVVVRYLGG